MKTARQFSRLRDGKRLWWALFAKFPCIFPAYQGNMAETRSQQTTCTAIYRHNILFLFDKLFTSNIYPQTNPQSENRAGATAILTPIHNLAMAIMHNPKRTHANSGGIPSIRLIS
jgi:hypothetical protein